MNIKRLTGKAVYASPLFALALILGGCSEDSGFDSPKSGQSASFKAAPLVTETRSVGTKVAFTPAESSYGRDFLSWENTDEIRFHFYNGTNHFTSPFSVSVESDGSATLDGSVPTTAGTYSLSAISPNNGSFFAGNQLNTASALTIDQEQIQSTTLNTDHLKPFIYLYANAANAINVVDESNWSGEVDLNFNVIPSFLRFNIDNWSEEAITLKGIKISYSGAGSFYTSYNLNESTGVVSPTAGSNISNMTLNTSNASIATGSQYTGYLAILPNTGSDLLDIELDILDSSGDPHTQKYGLSAPAVFLSGVRNNIRITISTLVEDVVVSESDVETIGGRNYATYTYGMTSNNITWMLDALYDPEVGTVATQFFGDNQYFLSVGDNMCPDEWYVPTVADLTNLSQHLVDNIDVRELFISHRTVPSFLSQGRGTTPDEYMPIDDSIVVISSADRSGFVEGSLVRSTTSLNIAQWNSPLFEAVTFAGTSDGRGARMTTYPLRCVRYNN